MYECLIGCFTRIRRTNQNYISVCMSKMWLSKTGNWCRWVYVNNNNTRVICTVHAYILYIRDRSDVGFKKSLYKKKSLQEGTENIYKWINDHGKWQKNMFSPHFTLKNCVLLIDKLVCPKKMIAWKRWADGGALVISPPFVQAK